MSSSIAVLNDKPVPATEEYIFGGVSSEHVIVVIRIVPINRWAEIWVWPLEATFQYVFTRQPRAPAASLEVDNWLQRTSIKPVAWREIYSCKWTIKASSSSRINVMEMELKRSDCINARVEHFRWDLKRISDPTHVGAHEYLRISTLAPADAPWVLSYPVLGRALSCLLYAIPYY